jgi:hypothetical protein
MYNLGDFQEGYRLVQKALAIYPEHEESKELLAQLKQQFTTV